MTPILAGPGDVLAMTDPVTLDGIPNRWRIQDIETHCPVHCPGCTECEEQQ